MPLVLKAYTDGACSGNPGPGGWGVVLCAFDGEVLCKQRELKGGAEHTTNNRMEMQAAIEALTHLSRRSRITVVTDSVYLKDGITKWLAGWRQRGWKNSNKKDVKNQDLWQELDRLNQYHDVEWAWVKGHAGDDGNERADELARDGMAPFKPAS